VREERSWVLPATPFSFLFRGIAQLVEWRSPKPQAAGSSPAAPAHFNNVVCRSLPIAVVSNFFKKRRDLQHQQIFAAMEKLTLYLKESYQELMQNVSWPTTAQLQESTTVVLVTAAILATVISVMDGLCKVVFDAVYGV
jgi:preprotein translocase subunit SecE